MKHWCAGPGGGVRRGGYCTKLKQNVDVFTTGRVKAGDDWIYVRKMVDSVL